MATLFERMNDDSTAEDILNKRIQLDEIAFDLNRVALQRKFNSTKVKAIEICFKLVGAFAPEKHEFSFKNILEDIDGGSTGLPTGNQGKAER